MRRRLEAYERRLAALAGALRGWSRDAERESQEREHHKILAALLRGGLEHAGLDPSESPALRDLENPPAWRRPRPFVHPLPIAQNPSKYGRISSGRVSIERHASCQAGALIVDRCVKVPAIR